MPGLPPNARSERIEDYKNQCAGIKWHEEKIRAEDGTKLSLCVSSVEQQVDSPHFSKSVYILYFQGNASSLPPRLPFLSPVLKVLKEHHHDSVRPTQFIMVCCSYRGYWRSKGRPSEQGIAKDAVATLEWIKSHCQPQSNVPVIIWGQSIGAGVATALAARQELFSDEVALQSLILETPFISIRSMLETLYPQKWLPYRYLWPFLRNHLDSWKALGNLDETAARLRTRTPAILFLEAGRDELVPKEHGNLLARRCSDLELEHRRVTIGRALHTDILAYPDGQNAVVDAIRQAADRSP
ncbi:hypothetical protein PVAG01_05207 [Phlyctema vagabunda]|uniref:Xaa-Pro dipeptidyl-peptidase-like domain-containing protein n=1 Tax=Phlyctema vagabunda TaxID=108571 RepID=A0ABR4PJH7_9HELO